MTGLEQGAPGEQRAQAAARRGQARVGSDLGDHGMEDAEVAREPLESERGGDLGFPEQPISGELSQPGPAGGEGVVIDQRQAFVFLQNEAGLAEQPVSEVGQGTQISLPTEPRLRTVGETPRFKASTIISASSGRTPAAPLA